MSTDASGARRVAQALDALRHGWAIRVTDAATPQAPALDLLPAETGWHQAGAEVPLAGRMLISAARAATLKLANQREAAAPDQPVLIRAAEPFSLAEARAVADPAADLAHPLAGPWRAEPLGPCGAARAAMTLARLAGILPAYLVGSGEVPAVTLDAADLDQFAQTAPLVIAARARLPVAACDLAELVAFRSRDDIREHVALVIGSPDHARAPLVRLHSECLTGDVLGSRKCDCGPQLDAALDLMAAEARAGGWGILLYMRQEGRGIGLINKLRAYQLQDQGFDTVDANERLGLPNEARDFPVAARMLHLLGAGAIRLLTNNPAKVASLAAVGVTITARVPHELPANPHNARYLATKRDRSGHLLAADSE